MPEENDSPEAAAPYVSPIIPDGWTFKATIPAIPGRWSEITLRYRPFSADEESEIWAQSRLEPGSPLTKFYAPVMAKKILGWNVKDHEGKPIKITEEVLRHQIPTALYDVIKQFLDSTAVGELEKN